jgi:hypothetical protein
MTAAILFYIGLSIAGTGAFCMGAAFGSWQDEQRMKAMLDDIETNKADACE